MGSLILALIYTAAGLWSFPKGGWPWKIFTIFMIGFAFLSLAATDIGQFVVDGHRIAGDGITTVLGSIG